MRNLRILFMGTPEFAVSSLKAILSKEFNVVGVITAPDKPAGRGRKLNESPVKTYAMEKGLTVFQPKNLKNECFISELKKLNANVYVVVAFRMLPKVIWQIPEFGTFNLHASLLPNYRGAAPITWVIMNGESKTGVSTLFIDDKIDTGDMILQESLEISRNDTAGELHDKLKDLGSNLVVKTLVLLQQNNVETNPQLETATTKTAHKLTKNNCQIDWSKPAAHIDQHVRGLSPYPAAWCSLQNNDEILHVKVYRVAIAHSIHQLPVGSTIATKNEIKIACLDGFVFLKEIKFQGKRKMDVKSLLNGFTLKSDAKMV